MICSTGADHRDIFLRMIVPQRAIQLRRPERLGQECDRFTVLQRLTCRCVNIGADDDRTYAEDFVDLARGLGATPSMCETQVHQNDVGPVGFRAGDRTRLGRGNRTDLMSEFLHKLLKAHRDDHLILDDQKLHVPPPVQPGLRINGWTRPAASSWHMLECGEAIRQPLAIFLHNRHSRTTDVLKADALLEPDSPGG
jgi:hypothetical protein